MPKRKKNPNGAGSISKKTETKGGKTYTYWRCRYSLPDGSRKEKKFPTQAEAQAFLTKTLADIQDGEYLEPSTITVAAWLDTWLNEYTGDLKYSTKKHYKMQCENHIKPALGRVKLCLLMPPQIQKFINQLDKSGKKTVTKDKKTGKEEVTYSPLSHKSIKNVHGVLSKALSVAVDVGFIKNNPAERVTLPRAVKPEMHPLDKTQLPVFLKASADDEYKYLLQILPLTGLRLAEATGLTWDCVDFNAGTLKINKQLVKRRLADGGFTLDTPKNGKSRIVKPAPFVMELLKKREREQIEQRFSAGEMWQGWQSDKERKTALVFTTLSGSNLSPQTVYNHCKKVMGTIGIYESCVHDLRHTYAVLSIQAGDDIKTISTNLGHATVAFTLDRYGHVTDSMRDESSRKMQQLLDAIL